MKKVIITIITILLIYTAAWFGVSKVAEDKIIASLEDLKKDKTINKYSADITIKGFPFNFDVTFEHPSIQANMPNGVSGEYNILYDGYLKLRIGLFSNSIKIITKGDLHLKGNIDNYKFHSVSTGKTSNYRISLKDFLLSPKLYKEFAKASSSPKYILNVIEKVTIYGEELKTINKLNGSTFFSIDKIDLGLVASVKDDSIKVKYQEELVNAKFSQGFMELWDNAIKIPQLKNFINSLSPNLRSYFSTFSLPRLGNMNHSINLDFTSSKDIYDINLGRLTISDAVENISAKGTVNIAPNQLKLAITSDAKFTAEWYNLMNTFINRMDKKSETRPFKKVDQTSILRFILGPINNLFSSTSSNSSYLPKLHEMGNVKTDLFLDYHDKGNGNFNLNMSNVKINTNRFYIASKGKLNHQDKRDIYNLNIGLGNYEYIVDYILDHTKTSITGGAINNPLFDTVLDIKTSESDARKEIKGFVRHVSDTPDSNSPNLSFTLSNDGSSIYPAIGRYNSEQFKAAIAALTAKITVNTVQRGIQNLTGKNITENLGKNLNDTHKEIINKIIPGIFGGGKK